MRGVALTGIWSSVGNSMAFGITTYFALNYVHFSPAIWGLIGTTRSIGFFAGTIIVNRVVRTLGIGLTMAISITSCLIQVIEPSALHGSAFLIFVVANVVIGLGVPTYSIPQVVLKQSITPDRLQGRMNATMNTMVWGMMAVGLLIGGVLGQTIGVVNTIYLGGVISGTSAVWILLSPVIRLKKAPEQITEVG